jgi:hypothetical protein
MSVHGLDRLMESDLAPGEDFSNRDPQEDPAAAIHDAMSAVHAVARRRGIEL